MLRNIIVYKSVSESSEIMTILGMYVCMRARSDSGRALIIKLIVFLFFQKHQTDC